MKAKKVLALCIVAAMAMSMAACGNEDVGSNDVQDSTVEQSSESVEESTSEVAPDSSEETGTPAEEAGPASIDFEDGQYGFVGDNFAVVGGLGAAGYSIADYNGSKALAAVPNGKGIGIGFQIDALLGDKVSQVKTIDVTIGASSSDGVFYACSGKLYGTYSGNKDSSAWSVYLETANPKTVTYTVPDGMAFGEGDNFVVTLETDNAASVCGYQTLYIDNVSFKDAGGNLIEADTSATYVAVDTGLDPNLMVLKDTVELDGFACSGGGWSQGGLNPLSDDQKALIAENLVPGSVIEIEYSSNAPVWLVSDGQTGWHRAVDESTYASCGYVAADGSKVQYTYEQLASFWGDGFEQNMTFLQGESSEDFEIYSVKIGVDSGFVTLGSTVELEGFACSGGGWSQGGLNPLSDDQKALIAENLVPGSFIEIEYESEAPVWLVSDGQTGWHRAVDESTFEACGAVADGKIQYTYEQLASFWGDGFEQNMTFLQAESSVDFEIYSVKIGSSTVERAHDIVELDGFACSGGGWSQGGFNPLTEEQAGIIAENLVPGSVINIEYASEAPVWLVSDGQTGWHRAVDESTFEACGTVYKDGTSIQYTYEQLASFWGDGFEQNMTFIQCESSADWEIYSVKIGQAD